MLNMQNYETKYIFIVSIFIFLLTASFWFRDIVIESTYLGLHTSTVKLGLLIAINLFIVSEALFFLAIFWTYFHSSLAPNIEIGANWPPKGIESINPFELPLLNTILLLSSGVSITYAHHYIIKENRKGPIYGITITILLAILFTGFQYLEYSISGFTLSDGIFGSCFYFGTGFHGLHVIIGTIFIAVGLWRIYSYHFTNNHHLGLESSILYWHFVDIVWIVLFLSFYIWGC